MTAAPVEAIPVPMPVALWSDEAPLAINDGRLRWTDAARGRTVHAIWAAPSGRPAVGLVLYLPAFGRPPEASDPIVRTLASAGYAVVALGEPRPPAPPSPVATPQQPLDAGGADARPSPPPATAETAPRPPAARDRLAERAAFAAPAAAERALDARFALGELERAAPFDWPVAARAKVAVVGVDLGAQTAQLIVGEQLVRQAAAAPDPRVRAAVLLAPFSSFEGPGFSERYRAVSVPLLLVFGRLESDPHGLGITTAQRREMAKSIRAPITTVELVDASVADLFLRRVAEAPVEVRTRPALSDPSEGAGQGGRAQRPTPAVGTTMMRPDAPNAPSSAARTEAVAAALRKALLVTRAFLDAELLGDADARQWLEANSAATPTRPRASN